MSNTFTRMHAWQQGQALPGVPFRCGDLVLLRNGRWMGQIAVLVALSSLDPPIYLAECDGRTLKVADSDVEAV